MLWLDSGVNSRQLDPVKLRVAAYYYNRARQWRKEVSLSTKADAYLAGSIRDFERQSRAPKELTDYVWQVDDPVLYRFGYTEGSPITNADTVVHRLVENVSRNGALLLNISPKADGTIPDDQQNLLLEIGAWLATNGEAIYGTRPWSKFGEGVPEAAGSQSRHDFRFTTKGDTLYALALSWPGEEAVITSLARDKKLGGEVASVRLLGHSAALKFTRDTTGLRIRMPTEKTGKYVYVLKISGLRLR
jgi:alpha-L-fucosidase